MYREPWRAIFDVWVSVEVMLVMAAALWLFGYRFLWRRDLTFFHASVPRIAAGIIVGYLPVFLIDEVWDLAEQPPVYLLAAVVMLGSATLLYLYVEVHSRLGDPSLAFARRSCSSSTSGRRMDWGLVVSSVAMPGIVCVRRPGAARSLRRRPGRLARYCQR